MRINNAGNVGIGTASPVNEFEVYGTGQPRITVRTVESISEALEIGFQFGTAANASTNTLALIRSVPTQVDPNPIIADLAFSTNSGDNVAERMRITGAGNVGIGTTSPVSIGGTTGILTLYGSNATALVLGNSAGTGVYFTKTGNDLNIRNTEAGYIRLTTSDTERMRVKSTGSVRFVPLASAPAGPEAGDVYYDSTTNKLRCYNGTTWNDLF
jgi:hypothetical protein